MDIYLWKIVCVLCALLLNVRGSLAQLDVCGRPPLNTKIVGGENAVPGSHDAVAIQAETEIKGEQSHANFKNS